jgi:4-alpha-glucanotransferase
VGSSASERRTRLHRLARLYGIERSYRDIWNRQHLTSAASERALLAAMGVPVADDAELEASLMLAESAPWRSVLPPVIVTRSRPSALVTLPEQAARRIAWRVRTEAGALERGEADLSALDVLDGAMIDGSRYRRYRLPLPKLPIGYHRLELDNEPTGTRLIVAPRRAFGVADLQAGERLWGVTAPLYGLRSETSWGIGDFRDLGALAELGGRLGAAFLGINPIHAQFAAAPERYSPYSPSSRRFLNVLLIAIEQVPELAHSEAARALLAQPEVQARLKQVRSARMIDYPQVAALKLEVLGLLFESLWAGCSGPRWQAFETFRREAGEGLERQALFDALFEHFRTQDPPHHTWRTWPLPYQDVASAEVGRFAAEHQERVAFFAYLQWLARDQLDQAQRQAVAGMPIGLYLDLAVGVTPDGAEAWADRDSVVAGASLGAPPDEFNEAGQNWGLAPLAPHGLRARAYAPMIEILRSGMRHGGALRIDHILGLQRTFWWPAAGGVPGAYVRQPVEDLLGVVALESHRQRCVVVGEDLGTVPGGLRRMLDDAGVLGCSVLYFEREGDGSLRAPSRYRPRSVASVGTHDLPTLAGFWGGRDIDWREKLGLYGTPEQAAEEHRARQIERGALLRLLAAEGLLPEGIDPSAPPEKLPWPMVLALHRMLARSPALLMVLQLEDALGAIEQANLPGTIDQHPNWCRRLSLSIAELGRSRRLEALAGIIASERPQDEQSVTKRTKACVDPSSDRGLP